MTTIRKPLRLALLAGLLFASHAGAEDIDIFASPPLENDRPNVLLMLDNSANWSSNIPVGNCYYKENGVPTLDGPKFTTPNKEQGTKMAIEKCALYNVIDALPINDDGSAIFNIGLMLANESPAANSGGYPRRALLPLTAANKTAFKTIIRNIGINSDKSNNAAFAKSLYEAYLYYTNRIPYKGTAGTKWDGAAVSGGRYDAPAASSCSRNYVIFIANGSPGEVTDNEARDLLSAAGGSIVKITYPSSYVSNSDQSNWADEMARFMFGTDVSSMNGRQPIVTYGVAVVGASSDGNYPNFIRSIAKYGGGNYYAANNADSLATQLVDIFRQIQSVNSVFSAASLPISVNARGTYLNQVFMGMFLPDAKTQPRWYGNIKQYQFAYNQATDSLQLVDSAGLPAINAATGFIVPEAKSFWSSASSFWVNQLLGTPATASDLPDGEVVQKGGAAHKLRQTYLTTQAGRKVFTCVACSDGTTLGSSTESLFSVANLDLTTALLGVGTALERTDLIDWVRGADNAGDEAGPGGVVTVRPSIHGDVLHSRPAVINYGDNVVLFYGSNDGMLRALVGNQTGLYAGQELWSFVAPEGFGKLKRLRKNSPLIEFPTLPAAGDVARRDYYFDGPIAVHQKIDSDGNTTEARIFAGMRRGGRSLYAFEVTNPLNPKLIWRRTNADIPILGQTWSEARVIKIKGSTKPVIIMGAGYDAAAEDVEPAAAPTMGNAVLVLNLEDGSLMRQFDTERPVAADIAVVDSDYDGYVDRAYAVDLGGNIYRIDLEVGGSDDASDWTINQLAALSASGAKKFLYAPDVVLTKEFAVVLAGTGDREKPLEDASQDFFFTVIDYSTGKGIDGEFELVKFDSLVPQGTDVTEMAKPLGCYLELEPGEKVVNAPFTIAGNTYFGTNQPTPPSPDSCTSNLGLARSYSVPLLCQAAKSQELIGGGLPPSPVGGIVEVTYTDPGTGETSTKQVPFIIGGENERRSAIEASRVKIPVTPRRRKVYWNTETER